MPSCFPVRRSILPLVVASFLVAAPSVTTPASGADVGGVSSAPTLEPADVAAPTPVDDCERLGTGKGDKIHGSKADNIICGFDGKDTLSGGSGNDVIYGGPGNDTIDGGKGVDKIYGGGGNDTILGGDKGDTLLGGPNRDQMRGDAGDDDLNGGIGEDTCRQNDGRGTQRNCEWPNPLLACPVPGGLITNSFGADRGDHKHQGVDIMADDGKPIFAVIGGNQENGRNTDGGLTVDLRNRTGFAYNAHLSRLSPDGRVKAGDKIGEVGSTGNAQGGAPHLHFEWHPGGGDAIDPYPYLIKACNDANTPLQPVSMAPLD